MGTWNLPAIMLPMNAEKAWTRLVRSKRVIVQIRAVPLILILAAVGVAVEQTKPVSSSQEQRRFATAVNIALQQGHEAVLPPHIAHLLGISPDEHQISVKQLVLMGTLIKGFEISEEKNDDIVIFVEDRSRNETAFYLTSPRGRVRKVVDVKDGVGYERLPTAADKKAFETEKQFWLDRLAPQHP